MPRPACALPKCPPPDAVCLCAQNVLPLLPIRGEYGVGDSPLTVRSTHLHAIMTRPDADNIEIERKYLVCDDSYKALATDVQIIRQGYLSLDPDRTVRVRRLDDSAFLTVKGSARSDALERFEWEHPIAVAEAEALFPLCLPNPVYKERWLVPWQGFVIEVDVFQGDNAGLVLAEIEQPDVHSAPLTLPSFIGREVTGDPRYYNSYLAACPFAHWPLTMPSEADSAPLASNRP